MPLVETLGHVRESTAGGNTSVCKPHWSQFFNNGVSEK